MDNFYLIHGVTREQVRAKIRREMAETSARAIELHALTANHRRWKEFYDLMEGPKGCNFRETKPGDQDSITWKCDNKPTCSIARRILAGMGFNPDQIQASVEYFHAHGGHCDCEILFNVKARTENFR